MIQNINFSNVYLIYVDESYDQTHYAYSAVFVPIDKWNNIFQQIHSWRQDLYKKHGIDTSKEIHSTEFIAGKGSPSANRDKDFRAAVFNSFLKTIETFQGIQLINGITSNKLFHETLFEYIVTRINNTLKYRSAYGILICDEGNENKLVAMIRKMKKANPVWSQFSENVQIDNKIDRIIEDPLFKTSKSSYFIQIADIVAFSLLRNEHPIPNNTHFLVKSAFDNLDKTLLKQVFKKDPKKKGIVRV